MQSNQRGSRTCTNTSCRRFASLNCINLLCRVPTIPPPPTPPPALLSLLEEELLLLVNAVLGTGEPCQKVIWTTNKG